MKKSDNEIAALDQPLVYKAVPNDKLRRVDLYPDLEVPLSVSVSTFGVVASELATLYWQDPVVGVDRQVVLQNEVDAGNKVMSVLPIDIINQLNGPEPGYGVHKVFYEMYNPANGATSDSEVREITVRILVPGGHVDPLPGTPFINDNLEAPQDIPNPVQESDLPLRVRINKYDNMREGDVIRLSWSGHHFVRAPLTAGEATGPVFIELTLDDFVGTPLDPGPGAGGGQVVQYDVHDIVNNWSLWSPEVVTDVEVGASLLPPRAPDWPTRIIDLALLGTANVKIEVPGGGLEDNDSVELFWRGLTADGVPIPDQQTKPVPVNEGGYSLFFEIDNLIVTAIPQGRASVYYEVTRASEPRPLRSKSITLSVIGVVQELPPPTLRENNGGTVDPNLVPATGALATVLDYTPMMKDGDFITLCGDGVKPDGNSLPYRSPPKPVFANMVGTDVEFPLEKSYLQELAGGTLELYYLIDLVTGPPQQESARLPLTILGQPLRLPLPIVDFESDGKLDPALVPDGTWARIPETANTQDKDRVYIYWRGNGPANSFDTPFPIGAGSAGQEVPFPVDVKYITGNLGRSVTVDYEVERPDGSGNRIPSLPLEFVIEAAESLPPPEVEGVQDGGTLNPDQVTQVWVRVPADGLVVGDYVTVTWTDNSGVVTPPYHSDPRPYTPLDVPIGFLRFPIPLADVRRFLDKTVSVTYVREDIDGVISEPSAPFTLSIAVSLPLEPFTVMGARYNRTIYRASGCSRVLTALHTGTQQPLAVKWRYVGDGNWSALATIWWDTQPSRALEVSSESHVATLNPANIFGSGDDTSLMGDAAFVAIRNGGDVVGWGNTLFGAAVPSGLSGIVEISSTSAAFASRDGSGNVRVWGDPLRGAGDMGGLPANNFLEVCGNFNAFAGIKGTRQVVAWGAGRQGTLVPVGFQGYADVTVINAASRAFAIQRSGGPAVSWGEAGYGGTVIPPI